MKYILMAITAMTLAMPAVQAESLSGDAKKTDDLIVGILKRPFVVAEAVVVGPPMGMLVGAAFANYPHEKFNAKTIVGGMEGLAIGLTAPVVCAVNGQRVKDQM